MKQVIGRPRMPSVHLPLKREIEILLQEDLDMSDDELRRRVLEARHLPTDPNDPFWKQQGKRRSNQNKLRNQGEHFDDLFELALSKVRNSE